MGPLFSNLNPNIKDEKPKYELVKDEDSIADDDLVQGNTVEMVTSATGEPHCRIAAAGVRAWVVMEDCKKTFRARLRYLGHAPLIVNAAGVAAGTLLKADGSGGAVAWTTGTWYIGHSEWPTGTSGQKVACWVERGYAV
jgi:hypothetical protein